MSFELVDEDPESLDIVQVHVEVTETARRTAESLGLRAEGATLQLDWTTPQYSVANSNVTLNEFAELEFGPSEFDIPLRLLGCGPISLEGLPKCIRDKFVDEVHCLRCHYVGFDTCAKTLVDDCRTYLFSVSSAIDTFERLVKSKVKDGSIPLHDGLFIDVRDIQNDVALFIRRVRSARAFLYARCGITFERQSWSGFIGENRDEGTFRPGGRSFIDPSDRYFQKKSCHILQFAAIGTVLRKWDRFLLRIFPALEENRRPDYPFQVPWRSVKMEVKLVRKELTPPNVQPMVEFLEENLSRIEELEEVPSETGAQSEDETEVPSENEA